MSKQSPLQSLYLDCINGKRLIRPTQADSFLESICQQSDPVNCAYRLFKSQHGLEVLKKCFTFKQDINFLNGKASKVLQFFLSPQLIDVAMGELFQKIICKIIESEIFWDSFVTAFRTGLLNREASICFARLLKQLMLTQTEDSDDYYALARELLEANLFKSAESPEIRQIGHNIKHMLSLRGSATAETLESGPGGRHDNDFEDFRKIAIMPTPSEIESTEDPFLRRAHDYLSSDDVGSRAKIHLDNQYRLLRHEMLSHLKEDLQIAQGKIRGFHKGTVIKNAELIGIECCGIGFKRRWALEFKCGPDFKIQRPPGKSLKKHLEDNPGIWRHQSLACVFVNDNPIAFPTVSRDIDRLVRQPRVVILELDTNSCNPDSLIKLKQATTIKIIQIDTPVFAFEPILKRLKQIKEIPLLEQISDPASDPVKFTPTLPMTKLIQEIRHGLYIPNYDLQRTLDLPNSTVLDKAQLKSLTSALEQRISVIQGPPGTGKSFIGALIVKALLQCTSEKILIVCYTNHALCQFLEDLNKVGIAWHEIVRIGGKANSVTEKVSLYNLRQGFRTPRSSSSYITQCKLNLIHKGSELKSSFQRFMRHGPDIKDIMNYLLCSSHHHFYDAFQTVEELDGMKLVDNRGKALNQDYLFNRWRQGQNAGVLKDKVQPEAERVWSMSKAERMRKLDEWRQELLSRKAQDVLRAGKKYNDVTETIATEYQEVDVGVLNSRRIIGCTTTGAAKHYKLLSRVSPGVMVVEEAGEILESHIITSLNAFTKQLVLIGDHKQLRPKVNNYDLTLEKGLGFNLNVSMFERMILAGIKFDTLAKQHRMRSEISHFVRELTYPELVDAPGTSSRPQIRGLQANVIFINHWKPEDDNKDALDRGNWVQSSKRNTFEAEMALKVVRYLGQQGYGSDKIVVLTPYLGQLRLLLDVLGRENDPVLNDLDSYDLVRAGLVPPGVAKLTKKKIRISTIDNYQGEESDIVVACLTRSNKSNDIGFMKAPERLNVLLSRARDGLVMIGNLDTFINTRNGEGRPVWVKFAELLRAGGYLHDGLPITCERHPNRTATLKEPGDFDKYAPDGGCTEPCLSILSCQQHKCPMRCHQIADHSMMVCEVICHSQCVEGHKLRWKCSEGPPTSCRVCDSAAKAAEKRKQLEYDEEQRRAAAEQTHLKQIAEIDEQIEGLKRARADDNAEKERANALKQKRADLAAIVSSYRIATESISQVPVHLSNVSALAGPPSPEKTSLDKHSEVDVDTSKEQTQATEIPKQGSSPARDDWEHQKTVNGANNEHIDKIMEMVGLEDIKSKVLDIKSKVDTMVRQNTDLKGERFNVALLGNPGTGKTTVARLYGKVLSTLGVLPGSEFQEHTGSSLANGGVSGAKKVIKLLQDAGGGCMFVDEAYQLADPRNNGGSQVLEYLLAEIENNVGKIAFIFAGYSREMEKFFEHNPGIPRRIPYTFKFADYEDHELLEIFRAIVEKKWKGRMKLDDGPSGLYARIATTRLGRGRGRNGFGNAGEVGNLISRISERQSRRLQSERRQGNMPDDFLLTKEDIIGPNPADVMKKSKAWNRLQSLIGLESVKDSIKSLFSLIDLNYHRDLKEEKPIVVSLNKVFLGNPGTGKTTVAKLYGEILAEFGLLSNGEVIVKNPADFVGGALGQSEQQTKNILNTTAGKVLVIDEAYMLSTGGTGQSSDPYKTAVIDTLVAEIQSVPGDDRCVLLLGYEDQMTEMFQNTNPGLKRRFPLDDAFRFEDFSNDELRRILDLKLKDQEITATDSAKTVVIDILEKMRNSSNFGNAGEVENLLTKAKLGFQRRQSSLPPSERPLDIVLEPQDFDADFDRELRAAANIQELFKDVVGCEEIVKKLENYQRISKRARELGQDPRDLVPTNFVFKGPPGTGKTTTARKLGKVFYDMGFLSTDEVVECTASDLMAEFVGQTGPKTRKQFDRGLGKVLFIDEAYRLAEGLYAKEAMDEIVDIVTKPKFFGKIVVILAGYDADMNKLMSVNAGLSSRFSEEMIFTNMSVRDCLLLLDAQLRKKDIVLHAFTDAADPYHGEIAEILDELSTLPAWGNARDVITLAKKMLQVAYTSEGHTVSFSAEQAISCLREMLNQRSKRATDLPVKTKDPMQQLMQPAFHSSQDLVRRLVTASTMENLEESKESEEVLTCTSSHVDIPRDPGVSTEIWTQLQHDIQAQEDAEKSTQADLDAQVTKIQQSTQEMQQLEAEAQALEEKVSDDDEAARIEALKRKQEAIRLAEMRAKFERAKLEKARREAEAARKREQQIQTKLRSIGVCPVGFQWVKQQGGYRCRGGSHFVTDAEIGV